MNDYRGSKYNDEAHGFGRLETDSFIHIGWFENNKPFGFGLRYYTEDILYIKKDVGIWEENILVQMAISYPHGMEHKMSLIFGSDINAFSKPVIAMKTVLKVPLLRLHSLPIPSAESKLVLLESELKEMTIVQNSLNTDLPRYRSTMLDVPIESKNLGKIQENFTKSQIDIINDLLNDEPCEIIKEFWRLVLENNKINDEKVDISDAIKYLNNVASHGPSISKIMETLEFVESNQLNNVLKNLRENVNVSARDVYGYSLLHCAVIANSTSIVNILLNAGATGVTCYNFTPLNLALMLHFYPRLQNKVELLRNEISQIPKSVDEQTLGDGDSAYGSSILSSIRTNDNLILAPKPRPNSAAEHDSDMSKKLRKSRPNSAMPRITSAKSRVSKGTRSMSTTSPRSEIGFKIDYSRVINTIVSCGIVKVANAEECTFLLPEIFWPILAGNEKLVIEMLLNGADVHASIDIGGFYLQAIHLSTETSPKVIAAIISARGDPNKTVGKSNEIANLKFKLNIKDLHLNVSNALFQCARRGHTRQTIALIKGGADINEEYDGNTPLGTAILNGHFELIQQLLNYGADPSKNQTGGGTPMGLVVSPATDSLYTLRQKIALIDLLQEHGAQLYKMCRMPKTKKQNGNTMDFVDYCFHPGAGPPPITGFFTSLRIDEQRNYLARSEIRHYMNSIIREQLCKLAADKDQIACSACFECGKAKKKLTIDNHFKVIAFCSVKCRKQFWRSNPSRSEIMPVTKKTFNFDPFFLQRDLKENYSFN